MPRALTASRIAVTVSALCSSVQSRNGLLAGNNPSAMDFYLRNGSNPTGHTGPCPNDPAVIEHEMLLPLR